MKLGIAYRLEHHSLQVSPELLKRIIKFYYIFIEDRIHNCLSYKRFFTKTLEDSNLIYHTLIHLQYVAICPKVRVRVCACVCVCVCVFKLWWKLESHFSRRKLINWERGSCRRGLQNEMGLFQNIRRSLSYGHISGKFIHCFYILWEIHWFKAWQMRISVFTNSAVY